jgi:hypothetical protein
MGADGDFEDGADMRGAAAGGEGPAAGATVALLGRQLGRLGGGGEARMAAAAVAGASALLAAAAPRRHGGGRVAVATGVVALGRGVGQDVGVVVGLGTAAVEALLEPAHLGFEVGETLLQLGFALLDARRCGGLRLGVGVGESFFELGFALGGAAVEGLVVASLLAGEPEGLLAGGQAARGGGRDGIEEDGFHPSQYGQSAGPVVGS